MEEQVCIAPAGLAQMWEFFTLVCTPTAPKYLRAFTQESEQLKTVIRSVKYEKRYGGRLVDESSWVIHRLTPAVKGSCAQVICAGQPL